jgi:DNA-binding NarL/FixJ family response regulator
MQSKPQSETQSETQADIQVVIVDDHPLMRQAIRQTLDAAPGFAVAGEAGDGKSGLDLILRLRPQMAVLDIAMPMLDGFGVVRELRKHGVAVEVVFLTAQTDEALFEESVALEVRGYILKECAASDVVSCLRAVSAGQHYVSPALTTYLMSSRDAKVKTGAQMSDLTAAELRVFRLIAELKTTREIAESLHVSPLTVETHRRNICEKLGLRGSNALVKFALARKGALQ